MYWNTFTVTTWLLTIMERLVYWKKAFHALHIVAKIL